MLMNVHHKFKRYAKMTGLADVEPALFFTNPQARKKSAPNENRDKQKVGKGKNRPAQAYSTGCDMQWTVQNNVPLNDLMCGVNSAQIVSLGGEGARFVAKGSTSTTKVRLLDGGC